MQQYCKVILEGGTVKRYCKVILHGSTVSWYYYKVALM